MQEKETGSSQRTASTEEENGLHHKEAEFVDHAGSNNGHNTELGKDESKAKPSLWKRLNPLHSTKIPPVPKTDAGLVPELQANWWSKLTWGWMGSLMLVLLPNLKLTLLLAWVSTPFAERRLISL